MTARLYIGDALKVLPTLTPHSAHCCITSPPYWGKRRYTDSEQEHGAGALDEWVDDVANVFDATREILTPDALLWVVVGDTAVGSGGAGGDYNEGGPREKRAAYKQGDPGRRPKGSLAGAPFELERAMMARGWILRSRIVWSKTTGNGIPEVAREDVSHVRRPKYRHEYVQVWSQGMGYFYNADVERSEGVEGDVWQGPTADVERNAGFVAKAPFPEWLVLRALRRSCSFAKGETVIDPYAGACTSLKVAQRHGLDSIGIDLDPEAARAARARLSDVTIYGEEPNARSEDHEGDPFATDGEGRQGA